MRWLWVLVSVCLSCAGNSAAVANALVATSAALAAAAESRAEGGCYASCPTGTFCDARTGYCEALPCHGSCTADEVCVSGGFFDEHCEPRTRRVPLRSERRGAEPSHDWP